MIPAAVLRLSVSLVALAAISWSQNAPAAPESWKKVQEVIRQWHRETKGDEKENSPVLRVVYFHGKDRVPLPGYQGRLTRVMDDISAFYREGLARYGIAGDGLPLEKGPDGQLILHMVEGRHDADHYNYESGKETEQEIREALAGTVDLDREFVLVLYGQCWKLPDGRWGFFSPYYGKGGSCQRWGLCHAADCELLDPLKLTDTESRMKYWEHYGDRDQSVAEFNSFYLGGIAHELGHGLGLPHDCESAEERRELGKSLMGSGNLTYRQELWKRGTKGSFLSLASAIRLASHPLLTGSHVGRFQSAKGAFQDLEVTTHWLRGFALSGKVESEIPAYAVIAYIDPSGGSDYDAETRVTLTSDGDFTLEGIENPEAGSVIRLFACFMNGETTVLAGDVRYDRSGLDTEALVKSFYRSPLDTAEFAVSVGRSDALEHLKRAKETKNTDADWQLGISLLEKWLQPAPTPIDLTTVEGDSCFLSDAIWLSADTGWGGTPRDRWGADPRTGQGWFLRLDGKLQEKGLPAHCPARHVFNTASRWKRFQATVGIRDGAGPDGRGIFVVIGDGKELHRSKRLREGLTAAVDVDISGVEKLELVTESGLDHTRTCWAVWGMPRVTR